MLRYLVSSAGVIHGEFPLRLDLLRNVAFSLDKQIVLTTHDKDFFELMKMKVPDRLFNSRFIEFRERGVIE